MCEYACAVTRGRSWPGAAPAQPPTPIPIKAALATALRTVGSAACRGGCRWLPTQWHSALTHLEAPPHVPPLPSSCSPFLAPQIVADQLPIRVSLSQQHDRLGSGGSGTAALLAQAGGAGGLLNNAARLRNWEWREGAQQPRRGGRAEEGSRKDTPVPRRHKPLIAQEEP